MMKKYVARAYQMGGIVGEKRFEAPTHEVAVQEATRLLRGFKVIGVKCVGLVKPKEKT